MEIVLVLWVVFAIASAVMAGSRGRSAAGWFMIGLLCGILGPILLLVLPDLSTRSEGGQPPPQRIEPPAAMKTCPDCAEPVRAAAVVCRHCGFRFDGLRA